MWCQGSIKHLRMEFKRVKFLKWEPSRTEQKKESLRAHPKSFLFSNLQESIPWVKGYSWTQVPPHVLQRDKQNYYFLGFCPNYPTMTPPSPHTATPSTSLTLLLDLGMEESGSNSPLSLRRFQTNPSASLEGISTHESVAFSILLAENPLLLKNIQTNHDALE